MDKYPIRLTIQSINATGRIGIILWIDKNTQWVQAQITASLLLPASGNIAQITTLTGYLELTDKNNAILASPANSGCLSALPFSPPDQPIPNSVALTAVPSPIVTLASTFFLTPPVATAAPFGVSTPGTSTDLNSGLPSSVMGGCNFHQGILIKGNGCAPCATVTPSSGITVTPGEIAQNCPYFTIDLAAANTEFCIDTRIVSSQCDPNPNDVLVPTSTGTSYSRIPIYAPVAGCIVYDHANSLPSANITLEVNQAKCDNTRQIPRLQINFTHVINAIAEGATVQAGDKIAEVCMRADWSDATCGGSNAHLATNVPAHIAFQLRVYTSGNGATAASYYWPSPQEYLKFLAYPTCLYDRWIGGVNNGTPIPQLQPTIQACP